MGEEQINHQNNGGAFVDYQDEISLADIAAKLWQRRGILLVLPVLTLLAAVIFLLTSAVRTVNPTVHFVELTGIKQSHYPNGTTFSPQDLLVPEVMDRLAATLHLEDRPQLRAAIQGEYGVPTTVGIQKKYHEKLAAKNLSSADITQINEEFEKELKRVTESGLRIAVNHASLGLGPEEGAALAHALPRAWADVFSDKYRVFVDTRLQNATISATANPLTTTSDILLARHTLNRMKAGLDVLAGDNRLRSLASQAGLSSADLQSERARFMEIYFRPLFAGMFANSDQAAASFLTETQLEVEEISRNIEEIDRNINDIRNFQPQPSDRQITTGSGETVQLGDGTLRQVIDLANQASLSDYLRQLLADRRQLAADRARLMTEISRTEVKTDMHLDQDFREVAAAEFDSLVREYTSLVTSARTETREKSAEFSRPLGTPAAVDSLLPPKASLVMLLAVILGVFMAVIIALAWPSRQVDQGAM